MQEQLKSSQPPSYKKSGVIILLLLALSVAASITVSPYLCCYHLIHAVRSQDITSINELVDFPVLRDNLKTRLRANMAQRFSSDSSLKNNPFAIFGLAIGKIAIDQLVDVYVSPAGIQSILQGIKPTSRHALITTDTDTTLVPPSLPSLADQNADQQSKRNKPNYKMGYISFNTFGMEVTKTIAERDHYFKLIMYRSGWYSWKLSDIQLPEINN